MAISINTNIAAYYAQANIESASNAATSNVARLSSGNAIVNASDNVAALAIGTSLSSQVSILNTAGTNATQGSSLLQVADGALAQIQSILQQQQSLASQAQSGALTDTDRGFLNQQFQTLTNEINSLASGTTFNGVALINGSIAAAGTVGSTNPLVNTSADTITAAALATAGTGASGGYISETAGSATGLGAFTYSGFGHGANALNISSGTAVTIIPPSAGGNDAALSGTLTPTSTSATVIGGDSSIGSSATAYNLSYTINGVTYSGSLLMSDNAGDVNVGTTATLQATSNPSQHAQIVLTVDTAITGDASDAGNSHLSADLTSIFTGATATTGAFSNAVTITAPSVNTTTYDTALQGDLSQGTFTVEATKAGGLAGTVISGGTATGYTISYSLNGVTYQGVLGNGGAGDGITATGTFLLKATTDQTEHASIELTVSTAFGAAGQYTDQSNNIQQALETEFQNANLLSTNASAIIVGTTTPTSGITAVAATNDIGKNDTTLVGDLSTGVFNVTGSNAAGFNVSYTLNGSTYQGNLSATKAANGGKLILDNGNGSLTFTFGAASAAAAGSAATLQSALAATLTSTTDSVTTGATAYAVHSAATTLASNSSGTIAGSGITTTSTAGTILAGSSAANNFNGADVKLTSTAFTAGASNLPPLSTFSATGTGTSTVFSVIINGVTYSTGSTAGNSVNPVMGDAGDYLYNSTWAKNTSAQGAAGLMTFFANGDATSNNQLTLNFATIDHVASVATTGDVQDVVTALNNAFGAGGSTGGLTFQLGATSGSDVTVNIGSATSTSLFGVTAQNISTQTGATAATTAVGGALDTITALRAGVGALESQFNFAAAAIQSSSQNEQAAAGDLLDTNIATESTSYATNQVKLQAGISVLAQANQQLQSLLKLIG